MADLYTTYQIVSIMRIIVKLSNKYPALLMHEGVFRIPSTHDESVRLIKQMLANMKEKGVNYAYLKEYVQNGDEIDSSKVNNILGMLPLLFKEEMIETEDTLIARFTKELFIFWNSVNKEGLKTPSVGDFINSLLESDDLKHQHVGEILYHYCHLMNRALQDEKITKMTVTSLATILTSNFQSILAPISLTSASIDKIKRSIEFIHQFTPLLEPYITATFQDFKETRTKKLEDMRVTRHLLKQSSNHPGASADEMRKHFLRAKALEDELDQELGQSARKILNDALQSEYDIIRILNYRIPLGILSETVLGLNNQTPQSAATSTTKSPRTSLKNLRFSQIVPQQTTEGEGSSPPKSPRHRALEASLSSGALPPIPPEASGDMPTAPSYNELLASLSSSTSVDARITSSETLPDSDSDSDSDFSASASKVEKGDKKLLSKLSFLQTIPPSKGLSSNDSSSPGLGHES